MKRIIIFILALVILAPVWAGATGAELSAADQAYQDIMSLASSGLIPQKLDKEKISRDEAAALIEAGALELLNGADASKEDIEKLYSLMKMFQTDMMEKGKELSWIEDTLAGIKAAEERLAIKKLEEKQDILLGTMGFRINGEAGVDMTDLLLSGSTVTPDRRYRPITEYIDLIFSARQSKSLYAEVTFRVENLFGGFWGTQNIYGVKKLFIQGNFPVSFIFGDFQANLTPLTLWAVDDERPFEAKVFTDKRDMNKKELNLEDDKWPLTGLKTTTNFRVFDAINFDVALMGARLAVANGTASTPYSEYVNGPAYLTYTAANFTNPHDRYLIAGRISTDLSFKDMLLIGANYTDVTDAKDTGLRQIKPSLDNYVISGDAEIKVLDGLKLKGEFAASDYYVATSYSAQPWNNTDIRDTAFRVGAEANYFGAKIEGFFSVTGNSFTAYAAQTRILDGYMNSWYTTQNNTWNVSGPIPYYLIAGTVYPFTKYNKSIVSDYAPIGSNLMPYFMWDRTLPYGGATPDRQGVDFKVSGSYLDAALMPYARYAYYQEIISYLPGSQSSCPRNFQVMEAGAKYKISGFTFGAGYKNELTDNQYTGGRVHLDTNIIDGSIDFELSQKWVFSAGCRDIMCKGTEYPYTYIAGPGWGYGSLATDDVNIFSWGLGADYALLKQVLLRVSYTQIKYADNLAASNNSDAQEIDAGVRMKF